MDLKACHVHFEAENRVMWTGWKFAYGIVPAGDLERLSEDEMMQKEIVDITSRVQSQLIYAVENCLIVDHIASMP